MEKQGRGTYWRRQFREFGEPTIICFFFSLYLLWAKCSVVDQVEFLSLFFSVLSVKPTWAQIIVTLSNYSSQSPEKLLPLPHRSSAEILFRATLALLSRANFSNSRASLTMTTSSTLSIKLKHPIIKSNVFTEEKLLIYVFYIIHLINLGHTNIGLTISTTAELLPESQLQSRTFREGCCVLVNRKASPTDLMHPRRADPVCRKPQR